MTWLFYEYDPRPAAPDALNWFDGRKAGWTAVARELGGREKAEPFRFALLSASSRYLVQRSRRGSLDFDVKREKLLTKLFGLAGKMIVTVGDDFHWLSSALQVHGTPAEGLINDEPGGPLSSLQVLIARYVANNKLRTGNPGKRARREFWTASALVYEQATGKTVATSTVRGAPAGPFVRYLTSLSLPLMPRDPPTPHKIDDFVRWYKAAKGRNVPEIAMIIPLVNVRKDLSTGELDPYEETALERQIAVPSGSSRAGPAL